MTRKFLKYTKIFSFFLRIEKRIRFVMSAVILTGVMLFSTLFFFDKAWLFIPLLVLISYALTFFSILEGIEKIEWLTLFIMPVLFTVALYVFYFLFPVRWLTRVPFILICAVSTYALLLTSNIFNVGAEKSLRLYKAAFSVNYFYHTLISFLIFNILFSLKTYFFVNGLLTGIIMYPLTLQLLWSIKLNLRLEKEILLYSLFINFLLIQVAMIASFVPFRPTIMALVLTAAYYSISGLVTSFLDNRLFRNTVREYVSVLGFIFIIAVLTLSGW